MLVADLAEIPELGITVRVPGARGALTQPITWCAPTESIDPSPFLTPGALMITSGMALNVTDARIWDAYVERLASVPIAALAFGLGPAHRTMPEGLVLACKSRGIPLLELPVDVPFILLLRDVEDRLASERYSALQRGSHLADDCTRMAANGATLQDVLHRISTAIGVRVSIEDSTGIVLLSAGQAADAAGRSEFTMPGSDGDRFRLVVEEDEPSPMVRTLIGPVTAVVSMQLSTTLGLTSVAHSHNAGRLTESIYSQDSIPTDRLITLTREADLEPYARTGVILIAGEPSVTTTYLRSVSWRARVTLAGEFPVVRFVEETDLSTILLQGSPLAVESLVASAEAAISSARGLSVVAAIAENAEELGIVLRLARRSLGTSGVRAAPPLTFDAVVETLRHPGTISMAKRLLAPLARNEDHRLLDTLDAYLRLSGATPAVCEELFVHRNTLAYRIRKIEDLLDVDLHDGQVRATLLMSLRLFSSTSGPHAE